MRAKPAGTVASLWRYPVKSMQGEALIEAAVTDRGVAGDRAYAIIDRETGHVASAKYPRKWGRLLTCRAMFADLIRPEEPLPPIRITFPDGTTIQSDLPGADQTLSRFLGRDVVLSAKAPEKPTREADRTPVDSPPGQEILREEVMALAAPPGTFFDHAPFHLLTTATLARLTALNPAGRFDIRRFRPNIVVSTPGEAFQENDWAGGDLALGGDVVLHLIDPCPRCVVTTLPQGDLPQDAEVLRTIAGHSTARSATLAPGMPLLAVAGVYACLQEGGPIRQGDTVRRIRGHTKRGCDR